MRRSRPDRREDQRNWFANWFIQERKSYSIRCRTATNHLSPSQPYRALAPFYARLYHAAIHFGAHAAVRVSGCVEWMQKKILMKGKRKEQISLALVSWIAQMR